MYIDISYVYIYIHNAFILILTWDVTEKVWLRAMYSDGIAAQTCKTEGDLKTEG